MSMVYYIRTFGGLLPQHFQVPRTPATVRRSMDGTLCVLAFDPGTQPEGWADGMDQQAMATLLGSAESEGVWWAKE